MALAAHATTISVSATDASYNEVDGLNDFSFGPSRDLLETTDFKDTSGAHTRMAGLKDGTISMSGDYESADTLGQNIVRTAFDNGTACWVKVLWDGATGHKCLCIVESSEIKVSVDGKVEWSATLQFNGAPASV
jgi:predicted secreted protein